MSEIRLDPPTLRALAAELDRQEALYLEECPCQIHAEIARLHAVRATDYRQRAIQADQAAAAAAAGGPPP